mgnify:CR=1 FL=1
MTSDRRPDSLAEQAAAWVPPWERASAPARADQPEQPATHRADEPDAEPVVPAETAATHPAGAPAELAPEDAPSAALADATRADAASATAADAAPEAVPDEPADTALEKPAVAVVDEPADATADESPGAATAARQRTAPSTASALALIDDDELRAALEAILLVVDEPVTEAVLAQVLEQPTNRIAIALRRLAEEYTEARRGYELRRAAGGWRLYTRPEYASYVERFVLDGQSVRLTQAALETLAVVAYKQPVTRSRISAIRGVNCDGVIRTLVTRGLVEECGTEPESGAYLYRTTTLFLEKLGLDSVDQLPPLAPFLPDNVEEIADAPR